MPQEIPIPQEFQSELRYVEARDALSDNEILESLSNKAPITSEKNLWTFWHSGIRSMPAWCQLNVMNWVRLRGPSWTIRVLDSVPGSPNNALEWATADLLPETFVNGTLDGVHQLEDPKSPFQVSASWAYGTFVANHFIASRKGNPFIERWHKIFIHLWRGRTCHVGIGDDPLIAFAKETKSEDLPRHKWELSVPLPTVMEYVAQVMAWGRLCMLEDPNDGFNGAEYLQKNILLFDSIQEAWPAEKSIGFMGSDFLKVLETRRDAPPESEGYQTAYKAIWKALTQSSMEKVAHAKQMVRTPALGTLLDMGENEGKDRAPGTFAELLRYGSVHFEQTREEIKYIKVAKPEHIMRKGLLEP